MVEFHSYFNFVKNRSEKQDYFIIWDDRRPDDVLVETKKFMKHDTAEMNNLQNQTEEKKTFFFFSYWQINFKNFILNAHSTLIEYVTPLTYYILTYETNLKRVVKKKCAKALGYRGFIIIGKFSVKLKKNKMEYSR